MTKVSVIIPAYNAEKYIEVCLSSVLRQTLREIEIIIVNDGSIDRTMEVVEEYKKSDERIKLLNQKNSGVSSARNNGLKVSKGKYIFQLDADDWLEENALEEYYYTAESTSADIVVANAYQDFGNGNYKIIKDGCINSNDLVKELFLDNILPNVWAKFYKRELFINHNIKYSEGIRIGEDLLMNFYLLFYANKLVKIEKSFIHYMQRNNSTMKTYKRQIFDIYKVFDEIKYFLQSQNLFDKYYDEFMFSKYLHTYFLRVVNSMGFNYIHKTLYDNWKLDYLDYKDNLIIENFLKNRKSHQRIIELCNR